MYSKRILDGVILQCEVLMERANGIQYGDGDKEDSVSWS